MFCVPLICVATNTIFSVFNVLGIYKLVVKSKEEVPNWLIKERYRVPRVDK